MQLNPIAIKQALAFIIDFGLIITPFIMVLIWQPSFLVADSETFLLILVIPWLVYIPLSEWFLRQTLGMRLVKTAIIKSIKFHQNTKQTAQRITLKVALRRHLARVSLIWGPIG